MEKEKRNLKVCKCCDKQLTISGKQLARPKGRLPVYCSKSCARKIQHLKKYGKIREEKECPICKNKFTVVNWNRDKTYCSIKCSSISRFGRPKESKLEIEQRLETILKDKKYFNYIVNIAKRLGRFYGVDHDDLIQDYFVCLLEGKNTSIEFVSAYSVRKEYNRGITGKHRAKDVIIDCDLIKILRNKKEKFSSIEMVEYLLDLKKITTQYEYKIIELALLGFGHGETKKKVKGNSQKFLDTWNFWVKGK